VSLFPALERALDLNTKGALTLVAHYQRPAAIRRVGRKRLATFLRKRRVKGADTLAKKALAAANSQSSVVLPAEEVAAAIVAELAREVLSLKESASRPSTRSLRGVFSPDPRPGSSLEDGPGMGPVLGAEFLVCVGDLCAFESADRLAAYAGLVPAAHDDSGKRTALTTVGCVGAQ
jgi:transposase